MPSCHLISAHCHYLFKAPPVTLWQGQIPEGRRQTRRREVGGGGGVEKYLLGIQFTLPPAAADTREGGGLGEAPPLALIFQFIWVAYK